MCSRIVSFTIDKEAAHFDVDWHSASVVSDVGMSANDQLHGAEWWLPRVFVNLVGWPISYLPWLWIGLDCPHADMISDKLTCLRILVCADVLTYSALSFAVLSTISRKRIARRGLLQANSKSLRVSSTVVGGQRV
jgi:hypothetical protein